MAAPPPTAMISSLQKHYKLLIKGAGIMNDEREAHDKFSLGLLGLNSTREERQGRRAE